MIIDGKKIAETVYEKTRERILVLGRVPVLTIITCAPNFETQRYLVLKEKKAIAVGIETRIFELEVEHTTEDFIQAVQDAVALSDGIIVQLPLPPTVDVATVVASIPPSHDADALNPATSARLSPVVATFREILGRASVPIHEKMVTIIGSGRLVGIPASRWFQEQGASVSVVTRGTEDMAYYTKNADIIVCGAGVPNLVTPTMVKEGVIILDAGTSEDGGELKGDVDPECAHKASIFTPVPGGVGPVTIAMLLSNVVDCAEAQEKSVNI